jgi:hypothetical protein
VGFSNSTWTPSHTVSTTNANDFLIFCNGTNSSWSTNGTDPTGFSDIDHAYTTAGTNFGSCGGAYQGVTSTQSSVTFTWGSAIAAAAQGGETIFDALTADGTVNTPKFTIVQTPQSVNRAGTY